MKPWKDVTLTDDYLFSQIMKDEDFCKLFLEMLIKNYKSNLPRGTEGSKPFPTNKRHQNGYLS